MCAAYDSNGARVDYASVRYLWDRRRHRRTLKGTWDLHAAQLALAERGAVVYREPCPHCHLGIWGGTPDGDWVHAAHGLAQCPDGKGGDCNIWTPRYFGDLRPWPPTGSCW
ncbi:hypothetical protein [Streptacidiphilus sp. PAMC 29251]